VRPAARLLLSQRRCRLLGVRRRLTWAFVFQTLYLLLAAIGGDTSAFSPDEFPLPYGIVALAVYAVGFALVALGRHLRGRRLAARTTQAPATA